MSYCPFEETLVPETNYVCVVYIRQRKEENTVSDEATKITSGIEKDFSLDIPPETFEEETILSLQVVSNVFGRLHITLTIQLNI